MLYVGYHPQNLSGSVSSAFGAAKNRMSGSVSQQVSLFSLLYIQIFSLIFIVKMQGCIYIMLIMDHGFLSKKEKDFHSEVV